MKEAPPKLGEIISAPSGERPIGVPPTWVRRCGRLRAGEVCNGTMRRTEAQVESFICTACRRALRAADERILWAPKKSHRHYSRIEKNGFPGVSEEMTEAITAVMLNLGITRPELLRRALFVYPPLAEQMERIAARDTKVVEEKRALIGQQAREVAVQTHAAEQDRINALPIEALSLTIKLRRTLLANDIQTVGQLKELAMPRLLKYTAVPHSAVGEIKAALKRLEAQLAAIERRLIARAEIAAGIEVSQTHTLKYRGSVRSTKLIVVLHDVKGMSWEEISAEVGLKPQTVQAYYVKALLRVEPKNGLSPERLAQDNRIIELRGRGMTWLEIGDIMDVNHTTAIVRYREARKRKRGLSDN